MRDNFSCTTFFAQLLLASCCSFFGEFFLFVVVVVVVVDDDKRKNCFLHSCNLFIGIAGVEWRTGVERPRRNFDGRLLRR